MRVKTLALISATAIVLAGCGGQQSSTTRRLAFITNNAADFWTIARRGTEKADAELADVTVEFRLGPRRTSSPTGVNNLMNRNN